MLTSRAKSLTRSACKEAKMERFITKTTLPPDEVLSEIYTKYYEQECPIGAFPHIIQRVARTVHEAQNLPMEFLCFIACGILSGTVGKSFRAYNAVNAYTQDANLYMLGLGASSSGKSASASCRIPVEYGGSRNTKSNLYSPLELLRYRAQSIVSIRQRL